MTDREAPSALRDDPRFELDPSPAVVEVASMNAFLDERVFKSSECSIAQLRSNTNQSEIGRPVRPFLQRFVIFHQE